MPISLKSALAFMIALALVGAACSANAESAPPPNTALPGAFVCPVTLPSPPHTASGSSPATPPARYNAVWYGSDELWTMLSPRGEVWRGLPASSGTLSQKTFWWSSHYNGGSREPQPAITVTGTRLDAPGTFVAGNPGTNAFADFGSAMLVGVDTPSNGCWELRAEYKGAALAYVVLVE